MRASSPEISLRYMPGLDVVRGLAIVLVLLDHGLSLDVQAFDSSPSWLVREIPQVLHYGLFGVHLFFILSGFLITGILLDTREDPDYFRNFYLRRVLRIVPAYVLMIAALKLTGHIDWRFALVALLYFANMPALFGSSPQYGPFWSLCVEEQFYLIWPLVVRRLAQRTVVGLAAAMIVLTPFLRLALLHGPHALRDIYYKTWVVGDFFAAGALLAIAMRTPSLRPKLRRAALILIAAGAISLTLFQALPAIWSPAHADFQRAFQPEPYLLLFSGMVLFSVLHPGIARPTLLTRPLVFLAYISYGLYLVHPVIMDDLSNHWAAMWRYSNHPIAGVLVRFCLSVSLSVVIAWISRSTVEKFFLNLKPKHRHSKSTPQRA